MQIGNITTGYRPIKNGNEFNRYFPKPEKRDRVIIEDGEVNQTVDLMKKVVWKYIDDTKKIAPLLKGDSIAQSCDNIWNFLYHHIQYQLDKDGLEQLRRPARSWHERKEGIDCDCFSIFASSILTNMGIPHSFRITKYDRDVYQHVYVIIPLGNRIHIIDPVLSKANYEKPFTQKKDFNMSIDGINVAVLSGPGEQDLYDAVMATHLDGVGLGSMSEEEELNAVYRHLLATRNAIAQNPDLISVVEDPKAFLKMLDYAIKHWNTPNRERALDALSKVEDNLNFKNGLSGIDDDWDDMDNDEDEELLGRWFKRKNKGKRRGFFKFVRNAVKKVGKGLLKLKKPFIRFNPLTITARAGFLLALKFNIKKMGSRLKWAYASKQQAAKHRISESHRQRARKALVRVEKIFVSKLYGKRSALKKAILKGRAGNLNGIVEEDQELDGLGFITTAGVGAMVAAATPVIVKVIKVLKSSGLMKKNESEKINTKQIQSEIVSKSKSRKSYSSASVPQSQDTNSQDISSQEYVEPSSQNYADEYSSSSATSDEKPPNKLLAFIKKNPLVLVGGIAGIGGIGYLAYSQLKKKKKSSSLKGLGSKRKKRKKKTRKSPKVKTIKLS